MATGFANIQQPTQSTPSMPMPQAPGSFGNYVNTYGGTQQSGPGDYSAWKQARGGIPNYMDSGITGAYQNTINARNADINYANPAYQYGQMQAQQRALGSAKNAGVRGGYGAAQQAQYQHKLNYAGQQQARQNELADAAVTGLANYTQQARGLTDNAERAMREAYDAEAARVQQTNAEAGRYGFDQAYKMYTTDLDNYRNAMIQYYSAQAPAELQALDIVSPGAVNRWAASKAAQHMPVTDFGMFKPGGGGPAYRNEGLTAGASYSARNAGF